MISNSNVGLASSRGTGESQQPNGPAPTSVDRCDARIEDLLYTVLYDRQRTDRIVYVVRVVQQKKLVMMRHDEVVRWYSYPSYVGFKPIK